ncbi:MAG: hypothetical protein WD042_08220 [Phycisphaeraceae bacterium]
MSRLALPGRVVVSRRRYHDPQVASVSPLDEALDLSGKAVSLGVVALSCRLAVDAASFARAGECLLAAAGLRLSDETLRQLVESEGKAVIAAQEAQQLELDWHAGDCRVLGEDGQVTTRLYMGCDGVFVPVVTRAEKRKGRAQVQRRRRQRQRQDPNHHLRGLPPLRPGSKKDRFNEMKLVSFYDQDRQHRLARATRKNHRQAGRLMRQGLVALRARGAEQRIALIDGAPWIARQTLQRQPAFTAMTLDYWHLAEHVHAARREVFGEQGESGKTWAGDLLTTLRKRGYEPFWQELVLLRSGHRRRQARAAIDGLMHYVAPRRDMLDYLRHQQQGWDIGSGPTESMQGSDPQGQRRPTLGPRSRPSDDGLGSPDPEQPMVSLVDPTSKTSRLTRPRKIGQTPGQSHVGALTPSRSGV